MFIFEFIVECLFFTICGWIGHIVVKAVTLGRIDLDWGSASESIVAEWLGLAIVLLVVGCIAWIVHN